ncbi:MAG TPA: hypothetical protein VK530_21110, partial [Candidatus Acidoferrum sp.]|nr:hypothetical protein [Candidatus Acidoferrum sp.]
GYSRNPAISDDGRYVVFQSDNTNMVANTHITNSGVYVRDIDLGITRWASAGVTDPYTASAYIPPTISADGNAVLFTTPNFNSPSRLYRFDVPAGTNSLLATNISLDPFIASSAEGRFVLVVTSNSLSVLDVESGAVDTVCGQGVMPEATAWRSASISSNGQRVAFAASTSIAGPWFVHVYDRATGARQLVSLTTNGEPAGIDAMSDPVISRDGRRIAFESRAPNIVAGDFNSANDIFVHDLSNNTTVVVSAAVSATSTPALASSLRHGSPTASARAFAFTSLDRSLDPNDDNTWLSAFVHDRMSGTNRVLATPATRALGSNRLAYNPVISTNGRYAAWYEVAVPQLGTTISATNIFWLDLQTGAERVIACAPTTFSSRPRPALSADGRWLVFSAVPQGSFYSQLFRRDMFSPTATNELLSYKRGTDMPGTGHSFGGMLAPNQKWVVFSSQSTDVVTNFLGIFNPQLIARHLESDEARWVSRSEAGQFYQPSGVSNFVISGNSRYVFFHVQQTTFPNATDVYRYDLKNRTNQLACSGCLGYSASDDGDVVTYLSLSFPNEGVCVRDLRSNNVTLIAPFFWPTDYTFTPQISADGRYVVFASGSKNLVSDDTNNAADIFVHDRVAQTTMLVSRDFSGRPGNGSSSQPIFAPDDRTVLFTSSADNLATNDFNNARDIFVVRFGGDDSDLDGMDDDWESAYFNALARDGTGDFDDDGSTDFHEFQAGTDPTNGGSILRVITVEPTEGGSRLVLWNAEPGRTYRVEFKNAADNEFWEELGATTATGSTASLTDSNAISSRIYRVRSQP